MFIPLSFVCAFWHTMHKQDSFSNIKCNLQLHFTLKWSVLDERTPRTIDIGMIFQIFKMKQLNTFRVYHTWYFNVSYRLTVFVFFRITSSTSMLGATKFPYFERYVAFGILAALRPFLRSLDMMEFSSPSQKLYMLCREDVGVESRGVNSL